MSQLRPYLERGSRRHRLRAGRMGALATATLMLAACAGASDEKPNTSGEPSGTISYWYAPASSDAKAKDAFVKYNVTGFTDLYPDITLDAIDKSVETIDQNIQVALAAGRGPDIVATPGTSNATPYAEAGYLADLSANYDTYGWGDKLLPWAVQAGQVDGKLVMIPQYYETLVLFYNTTLFEDKGWEVPSNRAELESLAQAIADDGITPFAAGNADYQGASQWLVSAFMNQVAGPEKIYSALNSETTWTDPAFADAIELLKHYFDEGWFGGGAKQYFSTSDAKKYSDFASGEAAMYISGTWEFGALPSYFGADGNTNEFDWVALPPMADGVPESVFPLSVGGTLSINAKTKNPYASAKYLDWILSDTENMWDQVAASGFPPLPIKFDAADIPASVDPSLARVYTELQSATETGTVGYTTWTSWGGKANTYIGDNIDKVLNGDMSVDDLLTGMDTAFTDDMERGLVPVPFAPSAS